jgi:hypothetical protein
MNTRKAKECDCDNGEYGILLWGVVSFDYTTKEFFLHAVDRTERRANEHRKMIQEEYRLKEKRSVVRVEKFESDHVFAQLNIGK